MPERLVFGIGNPDRGDDAVGRIVARSLRASAPADVRIAEQGGEAGALLAELQVAGSVGAVAAEPAALDRHAATVTGPLISHRAAPCLVPP